MLLTMEQFGQLFSTFSSSATRIEALDAYLVDEEQDDLALYRSGAPLPPQWNAEWAGNIRRCVANGKYMGRVHAISHTLTPYLQFEIDWYYAVNGAAGEDIRFIFRKDIPDVPYAETWLFDDAKAVELTYSDEGRLLSVEQHETQERLEQARIAWAEFYSRSFPLAELLAKIRNNELVIP